MWMWTFNLFKYCVVMTMVRCVMRSPVSGNVTKLEIKWHQLIVNKKRCIVNMIQHYTIIYYSKQYTAVWLVHPEDQLQSLHMLRTLDFKYQVGNDFTMGLMFKKCFSGNSTVQIDLFYPPILAHCKSAQAFATKMQMWWNSLFITLNKFSKHFLK